MVYFCSGVDKWAMTGKFSVKDLFNTIAEEALRAAYRMAVVGPLNRAIVKSW